MARIAVLTSGGDAPGMNPAIRALVKVATGAGMHVVGVRHGYEGLMDGAFVPLSPKEVDPIGAFGGTMLGSARSKRFLTPEGRERAAAALAGFDGLVVIGGNGSLAGARALAAESSVRVIGIPASIDNDIGCTSTALGVDTALNTIVEACDRISDTARAHRRVFVVEVMGRQCGYLAMASAIAAGADAVLFREQGKDEDTVVHELRAVIRRGFSEERDKQRVLVIKAEGVEVPTERLVHRLNEAAHLDHPGVDVRGTVLGHVVRGGAPSFRDRLVAGRLAAGAVWALLQGGSAEMVGWQPSGDPGMATRDPSVRRIALDHVLAETERLLDGSSEVTRGRVKLMEAVEGVLSI